jgi:hypothetical protein
MCLPPFETWAAITGLVPMWACACKINIGRADEFPVHASPCLGDECVGCPSPMMHRAHDEDGPLWSSRPQPGSRAAHWFRPGSTTCEEGGDHDNGPDPVAIRRVFYPCNGRRRRLPAGARWSPVHASERCLGGRRRRAPAVDPAHRLHAAKSNNGRNPFPGCRWHDPAGTGLADRCRRWWCRGNHRRDRPDHSVAHQHPTQQAKHLWPLIGRSGVATEQPSGHAPERLGAPLVMPR